MLTAYRVSKSVYGSTMWSGIGARESGGRWNSKGVAVVYTAENRSLAAMEQLVHMIPPRVLRGFVLSSVRFDQRQMRRIDVGTLPGGWDAPVARPALKAIGDRWVAEGKSAVLAVPSAVVRGEWNYLLNPAHSYFASLTPSAPEPFLFEDRLR